MEMTISEASYEGIKELIKKGLTDEKIAMLTRVKITTIQTARKCASLEEMRREMMRNARDAKKKNEPQEKTAECVAHELIAKLSKECEDMTKAIYGVQDLQVRTIELLKKIYEKEVKAKVDYPYDQIQRDKEGLKLLKIINEKLGEMMFQWGVNNKDK